MKYWYYVFICALIMISSGCRVTANKPSVREVNLPKKIIVNNKTAVILPFSDYSYIENGEISYRRNLFINDCIIDRFVKLGFNLPVQEDVLMYLDQQNLVNFSFHSKDNSKTIRYELSNKEWSDEMKKILQNNIDYNDTETSIFTNGLTDQELIKIGRHFSADYIVRGRILQYEDRQNIQLRIWVQDAYTGSVVWTNNYQYSAFGENATENAIAFLVDDFAQYLLLSGTL